MATTLDQAVEMTRTGDVWVFRGRSAADRAIQAMTNSPVNHVGMAIVLDDLPPLMWHAELGKSLKDVWTGTHQRGAQLHDLRDAVVTWHDKYHQRAWLRQLDHVVTREMEDAALRTVAAEPLVVRAASATSSTFCETSWLPAEASWTLRAISRVAAFCSSTAAATPPDNSVIWRT